MDPTRANVLAVHDFLTETVVAANDAGGHFNYAVALAKERQFEPAVTHFRHTLRLDPGNTQARKYLEQAEARLADQKR